MPLYEYQCEACGEVFEVIQKFSDSLVTVCKKCGNGPVVKLQSSPAFQFKGTGWYITDYARKDQDKGKAAADSAKSSDKASESKPQSDSAKTDTSKATTTTDSTSSSPAPSTSTPSTPAKS